MHLSGDILHFLTSPVMIIIGSSDGRKRPAVGRGLGIRARNSAQLDLVFSRWQWPRIAADIAETARLAVTCARPSDYVSYQIKGRALLRDAVADDLALAHSYREDIHAVLTGLGVTPAAVAQWMQTKDLVVAELDVSEAYVQTPGPRAGTVL